MTTIISEPTPKQVIEAMHWKPCPHGKGEPLDCDYCLEQTILWFMSIEREKCAALICSGCAAKFRHPGPYDMTVHIHNDGTTEPCLAVKLAERNQWLKGYYQDGIQTTRGVLE